MSTSVVANKSYSVKDRFKNLSFTNLHELVFLARKGLKTQIFYDFAETIGMPEKKLAGIINLSARTISNYKDQEKDLEPLYSEHLLKLISLFYKGESVFGNIDEFNYWLRKPFWNSDERPIDWITTPAGVDLLNEELEKLVHGYPV